MNKRKFGKTDLYISDVVLGTDYYGTTIEKDLCRCFLNYYTELGGNVIDTARMYTDGKSEEIIGDYLKERKIRNNIILSTKCAHPNKSTMDINRLSYEEIEADIDASLKALKTDYIDIIWLHRDDVNKNPDDVLYTMNEMVKKGKIRYFGASNWKCNRYKLTEDIAKNRNIMGFSGSQIQFSSAKCKADFDPTIVMMNGNEYEFYKESKTPVFAFSSQAKGFFEKYDKNNLSQKAKERYLNDENIEMYKKIKEISTKTGYSISAINLNILINNKDFDTFPIINGTNFGQLKDSLSTCEIKKSLYNNSIF